jgi:hypothetical protein
MDTRYDNMIYTDICYYKISGNSLELYDSYGDKKYVRLIFNESGRLIEENEYSKYVNISIQLRPKYINVYNFAPDPCLLFMDKNKQYISGMKYEGRRSDKQYVLKYLENHTTSIGDEIDKKCYVHIDINWCNENSIFEDNVFSLSCCTIV